MAEQDQKTEQATEKHLSEAFERGQFAKSAELTLLFPIAALLGVLALTLKTASRDVAEYASSMFTRFAHTPIAIDTITVQLGEGLLVAGRALLPILAAVVGAIILASGLQSGFRLSSKAATIKFDSLNIVAGFGRIFSKSVLVRAGIDLLKLIADNG